MNRTALLAGLGIVTVLAAGLLYLNRGARLVLDGVVQKVRPYTIDPESTLLVLDFRITNPSDTVFIVRSVDVLVDLADGSSVTGSTVSEVDLGRVFDHAPELGTRYNPALIARQRIAPRETADRMVAARFEVPREKVDGRRSLRIRITDVDGASSEVAEKK